VQPYGSSLLSVGPRFAAPTPASAATCRPCSSHHPVRIRWQARLGLNLEGVGDDAELHGAEQELFAEGGEAFGGGRRGGAGAPCATAQQEHTKIWHLPLLLRVQLSSSCSSTFALAIAGHTSRSLGLHRLTNLRRCGRQNHCLPPQQLLHRRLRGRCRHA
jgi:hypothetical protein